MRHVLPGVLLLLSTAPGAAQSRSERIEAALRSAHEAGRFNGVALVAEGGRVLHRGAYGAADLEGGVPLTPETPFHIRSLSKSFTAVLALQQVEAGRLRLDGAVSEYLPDFPPEKGRRITVHHLLTHTSGIRNDATEYLREGDLIPDLPTDRVLAEMLARPLEFEPGEGFAYSNTGYMVLGRILERVTGKSLAALLEERIFRPAGMASTLWAEDWRTVPGTPRGYAPGDGGLRPEPHFTRAGAGPNGIVSTVDDLLRFDRALRDGRLLGPEMLRLMHTPHTRPGDAVRPHPAHRFGYGYGFSIGDIPVGPGRTARAAMHGGFGYGGAAAFQRFLEPDRTLILLTNVSRPPAIPGLVQALFEPSADPGERSTFHVRGRRLYDRCGDEVVLRGVNKMVVWRDRAAATFPEIARTGANVVRIVWATSAPPREMEIPLRAALAGGMIPMIELHDATGKWHLLPKVVDYWTRPETVEVLKRHEADLLVNIANEAGDGGVTDAQYVEGYRDAIRRMRAAGIRAPLVIDAAGWGRAERQLLRTAPALLELDPDRNLLFSVHWWHSDNDTTRITAALEEAVRRDIPLIVGEFAHAEVGCRGRIAYEHIMKEGRRLGIGWLAWSWGPGNSDCPAMDMTTDGTFETLHGWGREVALTDPNGIRATSVRPHSVVHGRCRARAR